MAVAAVVATYGADSADESDVADVVITDGADLFDAGADFAEDVAATDGVDLFDAVADSAEDVASTDGADFFNGGADCSDVASFVFCEIGDRDVDDSRPAQIPNLSSSRLRFCPETIVDGDGEHRAISFCATLSCPILLFLDSLWACLTRAAKVNELPR